MLIAVGDQLPPSPLPDLDLPEGARVKYCFSLGSRLASPRGSRIAIVVARSNDIIYNCC